MYFIFLYVPETKSVELMACSYCRESLSTVCECVSSHVPIFINTAYYCNVIVGTSENSE